MSEHCSAVVQVRTTWQMIKAMYEEMAARHRQRVAECAPPAQTAEHAAVADQQAAELPQRLAAADDTTSAVEGAPVDAALIFVRSR